MLLCVGDKITISPKYKPESSTISCKTCLHNALHESNCEIIAITAKDVEKFLNGILNTIRNVKMSIKYLNRRALIKKKTG